MTSPRASTARPWRSVRGAAWARAPVVPRKTRSATATASGPLKRTTASAERPSGVPSAAIVSLMAGLSLRGRGRPDRDALERAVPVRLGDHAAVLRQRAMHGAAILRRQRLGELLLA